MRSTLMFIVAATALAGCSTPTPPTSQATTTPPPTPAAIKGKVVPVDAAAATKDLEAARSQKGYKECGSLKPVASSQALVDQGQALYSQNCASCHGDQGKGDGPAGAALDPKPRNLTKTAEFKYGHRELAIFRTVKYGIEGSGMAPWEGRMTDEEIWKVVFFVRGLGDS